MCIGRPNKGIIKSERLMLNSHSFYFYERITLSDVLTNTRAAEIGTITTITAKNILLKNALNEGVILIMNFILKTNINYNTIY